jgi:hypothetical protein
MHLWHTGRDQGSFTLSHIAGGGRLPHDPPMNRRPGVASCLTDALDGERPSKVRMDCGAEPAGMLVPHVRSPRRRVAAWCSPAWGCPTLREVRVVDASNSWANGKLRDLASETLQKLVDCI